MVQYLRRDSIFSLRKEGKGYVLRFSTTKVLKTSDTTWLPNKRRILSDWIRLFHNADQIQFCFQDICVKFSASRQCTHTDPNVKTPRLTKWIKVNLWYHLLVCVFTLPYLHFLPQSRKDGNETRKLLLLHLNFVTHTQGVLTKRNSWAKVVFCRNLQTFNCLVLSGRLRRQGWDEMGMETGRDNWFPF